MIDLNEYIAFDQFEIKYGFLSYCGPRPQRLLEGLAISIFKWRRIVKAIEAHELLDDCGTSTCGLCMLYDDLGCTRCPVSGVTGAPGCMNTPYSNYVYALRYHDEDGALGAAKKELVFLQSLWEGEDANLT
jgi:hypothetical protein